MAIREALLALLERGPANAYQLKKDFDRTIGLTWPLNMGQVSTTLQRLGRDGLVEEQPVGDRPADKSTAGEGGATADIPAARSRLRAQSPAPIWRLTPSGRRELERWWRSPVTPEQRGRDELVMKLAVAVEVPGLDVSALIQHQRHALQQLLHDVTRLRRNTPADEVSTRLVLDHHLFITEAELRWLDTVDAAQLRASIRRAQTTTDAAPGTANDVNDKDNASSREGIPA